MPFEAKPIELKSDEREELRRMSMARSLLAGDVLRSSPRNSRRVFWQPHGASPRTGPPTGRSANLSAHKTKKVAQFLAAHPTVKLHFTPTYSSWLNQVEIWFSRIERDVIARGVFTSVKDLARKLMHYIQAYSKNAKPFRWKYSDVKKRIRTC